MKGKIKKDKYLLEIGTYTQDDSICKIDVNDIYVKIDDRIRFYSKKLNKELIFISMNKALNDFYPKFPISNYCKSRKSFGFIFFISSFI